MIVHHYWYFLEGEREKELDRSREKKGDGKI